MVVHMYYSHRTLWIGEGFKNHVVPTLLPKTGTPSLDQICQSSIQPNLEPFQGWHIHNFSEQPVNNISSLFVNLWSFICEFILKGLKMLFSLRWHTGTLDKSSWEIKKQITGKS